MVYGGSIIQDNVPLAQGYGIQDQDDIFIFPRGDLPPRTDGCNTFVDPEFHSLPASSSSVKVFDEKPKGVRETAYREATPDSRAAQPLFAEEEGKSSVGRGMDPSGILTLPKPLLAGDSGKLQQCRFLNPCLLPNQGLGKSRLLRRASMLIKQRQGQV